MRVVITQRRLPATPGSAARDALDVDWAAWLMRTWPGSLHFPMPNEQKIDGLNQWLAHVSPSLVILSGGNDIGESACRDGSERSALVWCSKRRIPVLGVCRGMQMMHTFSGGQLVPLHGHVGRPHQVAFDDRTCALNSWHHFGIERCVAPWKAMAVAEDGSVEAMQHGQLPWLGVMWHPEREQGHSDWLSQHLHSYGLPASAANAH